MNLPRGDSATIDTRKIVEYCLNPEHDDGQHKTYLFDMLLGLNIENAALLIDALRQAAEFGDAQLGRRDKYGQRYVIDFEFEGPAGSATIRSAWIIGPGELIPRFVTCYIL
jgi:hypothetical protein